MRMCEICDCRELCKRIAECGGKDMKCAEVRKLVLEIIAKNTDEGDDE